MPELPEMQALAERLDAVVGRTTFAGADPLQFTALKTVTPAPDEVVGRQILQVARRGKFLVLELDGPRLLLHLSQGGRVTIEDPPRNSRPKRGVVRLRFVEAPALLVVEYGTERKAGWWVLAGGDDGPLARLGPEPHDERFVTFIRTSQDTRRLHTILRDQHTVAGIGRGYADDILHQAGLSPFTALASLDGNARERLIEAIGTVLAEGLAVERRRRGGLPTKLGEHWIVHGRAGQPCPRCGASLARVSYESYEVAYCPACQTEGRVLKDRRLSRLLK
ncbi:MAG: Fpg/Nei family DNA glycosylase [Actinomycetota bacterium]|nr:Fpg/Nei family DNA glycosylase [Actinomycetota bacterium]